jgi:hypothetical protein
MPKPEYGMVEIGAPAISFKRLSSTRASQGLEQVLPPPATNFAWDFTVKSEAFVFPNIQGNNPENRPATIDALLHCTVFRQMARRIGRMADGPQHPPPVGSLSLIHGSEF